MTVAQTWTMPAYLTALRDNLQALPALDGVQVRSAPIANDQVERKAIAFVDVLTEEESAALGDNRRREVYIIEGVIQVLEPGKGEEAAVAARDEAARILAAVEKEINLNPDAGLNVAGPESIRFSGIVRKDLRQAVQDQNRRVLIEFDIEVQARISPKNT